MRRNIPVILLLIVFGRGLAMPGDIYTLICEGRLQEAADSLSIHSSATLRDGRLLFLQSFIEKDGGQAAQQMRAALNATVPARFHEEIYFRLAQYYYLNGETEELARLLNDYRAFWETGRYEIEMSRFAIMLDQQAGDYENALRQVDRFLLRYSRGEGDQWGKIDKARILSAIQKDVGARQMLRSLSRDNGVGAPQALYMLTLDAIRQKRTDDAVFYYNLLRERYPSAIGLDYLVRQFGDISSETATDSRAEELTGTYYAVKVGVFAEKQNARTYADSFKAYDQKIDIAKKQISGQNYHVVYVGRFKTFADAQQFKTNLESRHKEVYQVVAR